MAVFSLTRGATAADTFDEAPAAIALLGGACLIERATALFLDLYGGEDVRFASHESDVERVVAGELNQLTVIIDGIEAEICAVIARDGQRYALLTVPVAVYEGDGANPLLDKPIDASTAIIWLKDLDGRYVRVNPRYAEHLQTDAEHVRGKTDGELSPGESIEGLRVRESVVGAHEPLELEYTVAAFGDRPAFAVVRFALRDGYGKPIAVCGVAAPLAQAWLARSECARLMRIDRLSRLDELAIREELLDDWGLTQVTESARDQAGSAGISAEPDGEQFTAIVAELDGALATSARLDQQLAEERRQVMALREASILAARRSAELLGTVTAERTRSGELEDSVARAETRLGELQSERDSERSRAEQLEVRSTEAIAEEREIVGTLRVELLAEQEKLKRLRAAASAAPTPKQLQVERARAHGAEVDAEQARAEAARSAEALEAERQAVEALRADLRAAQQESERARQAAAKAPTKKALGDERVRADQAEAALTQERERAEQADAEALSALARAREELARAHADAAARTAALSAEQQDVESLRAELTAVREELGSAQQAAARSPNSDELEQLRLRAKKSEAISETACEEAAATATALDAERQTAESLRVELREANREIKRAQRSAAQLTAEMEASNAAALEAEREAVEALRADLLAAQQESERARQAAAQAPTKKALGQERVRADQAEAALTQERERAEQAEAEALSVLARVRDELARAHADAAARTAALSAEQQDVESLRDELTAVREELGGAQHASARSANSDELEQLRLRAKKSEAISETACEEAAASATALDAERQTAESLRVKLRAATREIKRVERSAAEVTAEMEASADLHRDRELAEQAEQKAQSALAQAREEQKRARATAAAASAALAAEQHTVRELQTELGTVAEELKRMQHAADAVGPSAPTGKKLDHERTRAERAEVALEAQKQTILTLRTELKDSSGEVARLHAQAPGKDGGASDATHQTVPAEEPVSSSPAWDAASQRNLSAALGGVLEWRAALKRAATVLGSEGRWDAVVAWSPEGRRSYMKCAAMWTGDDAALSTFETDIWQHRRDMSAAEFGSARERPAPTPVLELQAADDVLLKAAARVGMCSAVLIPIRDGEQTIGMLEVFSRTAASPSSELLLSLEGIALQLSAVAQLLGGAASASWRTGRL